MRTKKVREKARDRKMNIYLGKYIYIKMNKNDIQKE